MAAPTPHCAGLCLWLLLRLRRGRRLREAALGLRRSRSRRARARRRFAALCLYRCLLPSPPPPPGRVWSRARSSAFWDTVRSKALSGLEWAERFRLQPNTFDFVCGRLRSAIERRDTAMRRAVPADVRLALTLWRLGACTEYRALEQRFGVSRSTVCKVLRDVCEAAVAILAPAFAAPPQAANGFALPQLCGVLSRLRVPIRAPAEDAARYSDGRGWHTVVLQAAVDSRGCFWAIEVNPPGTDLRSSALYRRAQRGGLCPAPPALLNGVSVPPFLLGRKRDPLLPWLLRPYRACATERRRRFNQAAAQAAAAAREALGGLRGRWRCLQRRNDTDLAFLPALLGACCLLHNVCQLRGEPCPQAWVAPWDDGNEDDGNDGNGDNGNDDGDDGEGEAERIREALAAVL